MEKARIISKCALPIQTLMENDFQLIRTAIGDAQVVLLGEATHGTKEFYEFRVQLTKALVKKEGFNMVLCEGDFPPFSDINRYITKGEFKPDHTFGKDEEELASMSGLTERFPEWMWYNKPFRELVKWLRHHNSHARIPVNLFGLDIYSLFASANRVITYLDHVDASLASLARQNYGLLNCFRPDPFEYTHALQMGIVEPQAPQVAKVLAELLKKEIQLERWKNDGEEFFSAAENAHVVQAAESYYRKSFLGGVTTWNIRDRAMADFVQHAIRYKSRRYPKTPVRLVIWAHNSHVGNADATERALRREYNIGSLLRDRLGTEKTFTVGFSTDHGTVRAAKSWGGPSQVMDIIPSLENSHGHIFHCVSDITGLDDFGLLIRANEHDDADNSIENALLSPEASMVLKPFHLQRFIGVQYVKATERYSHYSECSLIDQYDLLIHYEKSTAVDPIPKMKEKHIDEKPSEFDEMITIINADEEEKKQG